MVKVFTRSLVCLSVAAAMVSAQTMEETISKLGAAAGKAYVAPIVSGFGSNLNAGWYHKAPSAQKFGFHFEAGVIAMGTLLSGGDKNFSVAGAFRLDSAKAQGVVDGMGSAPQSVKDSLFAAILRQDQNVLFTGETVIGPGDEDMQIEFLATPLTITKPNGVDTTVNVPAYTDSIPNATGVLGNFADIPLPLFAPQISIGTIYGTNLTFRWLPEIETNADIGTVKFFGFGIQHNPGVWFPNKTLPVDLSVGYFTQTLEVGTLFKASSSAVGLNVSKTLGWRFLNVTPYGGLQFEKSSFDFAYDLYVDGTAVPIDFTVEGENKYRATAGVSVRLLAININGDFNYAKYPSYSMGVMIGI